MFPKGKTEHVNRTQNRRQVENGTQQPKAQEPLVVPFLVTHRMELHTHGVGNTGGKEALAQAAYHRTNLLGGKGIGQVILSARKHGYHRCLEAKGAAFQFIGNHNKGLKLPPDHGMLALRKILTLLSHIQHRIRPQSVLQPVRQLGRILLHNPDRHMQNGPGRKELHHEHGHAHRQQENHQPQDNVVAQINLLDRI